MMKSKRFPIFTNTYVAFLKYIKTFNLDRELINGSLSYSYVNSRLADVYTKGKIFYSKDYSFQDGHSLTLLRLESVLYQELFFSFVVTDKAIILTDLCDPTEWQSENVLLGAQIPEGFCPDSVLYNRYTHFDGKSYTIIATYNAFCSFSDAYSLKQNLDLNEIMFNAFTFELSSMCPYHDRLEESGSDYYPFEFICIEDVIILYNYSSVNSYKPSIYPIVSKDTVVDDLVLEDDSDCNLITLYDLTEWGAFTDEGEGPFT